jgi:hypothetical protein
VGLSRDVNGSRDEAGFSGIGGSEYNRELGVIDPSSFPINFWLHGGEPWVSEYGFVFPQVGEEESEGDPSVTRLDG